MRDAFVKALSELAESDPSIILLTADLGYGVLTEFAERFPSQYLNVGVAEQNMAGIAAGLAMRGRTVFTYSIANFPTLRCLEQIRNDICHHHLPVTIVGVGAGLSYGPLGFSHHATEELGALRSLPDIVILCPSTDDEVFALTSEAAARRGPTYLRLDRSSAILTEAASIPPVRFGEIRELRSGTDVFILSCGALVGCALEAARRLDGDGFTCGVGSVHSIKPLDRDFVRTAAQNSRLLVTLEEHSSVGGLGSAVAEVISELATHAPLARVGLPEDHRVSAVGSQDYLRSLYGLTADHLAVITRERLLPK